MDLQRWRPRWYELVPEALLLGGLIFFLVDETDAATSALKSTRAVGLIAATAVAWVAVRVVLAWVVPWSAVRMAVMGAAALAVLAVVVLPAYDNDTVVEAFPEAATADPVPPESGPPTMTPSNTEARTTTPPGSIPSTASHAPTLVPAAPDTTVTTTTTAASEPVRLRTGEFIGIDHRAEGTVSIYRAPDGRHVVGLESFDIQPGPDYDVYVVPGRDRRDRDGGTRLDDLRGNQGTQYYEVPPDVDIGAGEWTVLIWCQTFAVPVANATPI